MKLTYIFLLTLFLLPCSTMAKDTKKITSSTKIYSQKIEFNVPKGWKPVFENATQTNYILELTPKGQTKEKWTEMFSVQGFKGLAQKADPQIILALSGKMHKDFCGEQMIFNLMKPFQVFGYPAQSAIVGCASIDKDHPSGLKKGMSEIAYYIAVKGEQDIYLFHKAKRGKEFKVNSPPLNMSNADDFISNFMPFKICNGASQFHECLK